MVLEWDIFYPLPSTWYKPTTPTKAAPKPEPVAPAPEIIESWDAHGDPHSDHPGEVWVPSGGWSSDSDVIKTLSEAETEGKRRTWSGANDVNVCKKIHHKFFISFSFHSKSNRTFGIKIIYSVLRR